MEQKGRLCEHLQRHHTGVVGYTLDGVVRQEEMVVGGEGRLDHQLLTLLQSHDLIDEGETGWVGDRRCHAR